jgi:hypothetical protein
MFNRTTVITDLYGLVGFRQPLDPDYDVVDANNLVSRSGYYVNDNPFAKIEILKDVQDYRSASDAQFNAYLKQIQQTAISNVCNQVFNRRSFNDRNMLYKNAQNLDTVETLPTGFVGYRIEVTPEKNIAFKITRVLCGFSGTGTFTLYLYNTGQKTAIQSKEITITKAGQEVILNWEVNNTGETYKGDYYVGYLTKDLTIEPYARDYRNSNVLSKYSGIDIYPVSFPKHTAVTIPNLKHEQGSSLAFGINLDITVYDDFTDLIIQNENLFAYAIYLDCVIMFLSNYLSSLRSNPNQREGGQNIARIMAEIEGQDGENVSKITGLRPSLLGELANINKEIQKLQAGYFGDEPQIITLS